MPHAAPNCETATLETSAEIGHMHMMIKDICTIHTSNCSIRNPNIFFNSPRPRLNQGVVSWGDPGMLVDFDYSGVYGLAAYRPMISEDLCQKCGTCAHYCRNDCIKMRRDGYYCLNTVCCTGCGTCVQVCPANAIEMTMIGGVSVCC